MNKTSKRVCLGAFAGAHGVKGDARIRTFTAAPENIADYGPVTSENGGRRFTLHVIKVLTDNFVLARAPEIKSREDAEALRGTKLYVERSALPEPVDDEYYLDDLIGLTAVDETGAPMGSVRAVYNFGAGDLLELENIPDVKGVRLVSFTRDAVPRVNLAEGRVTVRRDAALAENASQA